MLNFPSLFSSIESKNSLRSPGNSTPLSSNPFYNSSNETKPSLSASYSLNYLLSSQRKKCKARKLVGSTPSILTDGVTAPEERFYLCNCFESNGAIASISLPYSVSMFLFSQHMFPILLLLYSDQL